MKLEHDDACWQNIDIISMKCSNLNVVYMNFFYSHTDGRGCRARCQLDQEQFGVQYLAQGHSDMQLGGVGTRTSDWLLDNALYLLSYSRPKLWPLTLTCYPGDWGGGVTGCTEWLCYLLCLPLQAGFIFLHLCVCVCEWIRCGLATGSIIVGAKDVQLMNRGREMRTGGTDDMIKRGALDWEQWGAV